MNLALVLLLAQTCVAEINIPMGTDECVAMWEVNARNASRRGLTVAQQTREFNAYWRMPHTSRAWIGALTLDGAEPVGWTPRLPWARHRARWLAVVERAKRFVADYPRGRHRSICPGADDYGGIPDDGVGAEDPAPCRDAVRVACIPEAKQAYWRLAGCRAARRARAGALAP